MNSEEMMGTVEKIEKATIKPRFGLYEMKKTKDGYEFYRPSFLGALWGRILRLFGKGKLYRMYSDYGKPLSEKCMGIWWHGQKIEKVFKIFRRDGYYHK